MCFVNMNENYLLLWATFSFCLLAPSMSAPSSFRKAWLAHYAELIAVWRNKPSVQDDAQDALQDAAVRLLENAAEPPQNPRAYLQRSVRNGLVDVYRRHVALPTCPWDQVSDMEQPAHEGPEAHAHSRQMMSALQTALEQLPLRTQQVYILCRIEGYSHKEIASRLGLSRDMVEKHMNRCLRHLQEHLQNYAP